MRAGASADPDLPAPAILSRMSDTPPELTSAAARAAWAHAEPVLARLRAAGHQAWLVGGVVRDLLLGRPPGDVDLATEATPEALLAIFPEAIPTGLRHGTITVLAGGAPVEITTFRAERGHADARHPDAVTFLGTIEEDLARRDFTINALAFDPASQRFVDLHDGRGDLARRRVRTVGDARERFHEDGLRPYRAIRFAVTLGFDPDPALLAAVPGVLDRAARVSPERVRDELNRMLGGAHPSDGFEWLRETGLLNLVLPELLEGYGMPQNRWHAYDVYTHILFVVDAAPADNRVVRLAALFHDIGKPRTRVVVDGEGTFYNHEIVGAEMARVAMDRLRFPGETIDAVVNLVRNHMFDYQPVWSDAAVRRLIRRVGVDALADLFDLRLADMLGHGPAHAFPVYLDELRERIAGVLARQEALQISDLRVTGRDVMETLGLAPGPRVGEILRALLERVLEDPARNDRDRLLADVRALGPGAGGGPSADSGVVGT